MDNDDSMDDDGNMDDDDSMEGDDDYGDDDADGGDDDDFTIEADGEEKTPSRSSLTWAQSAPLAIDSFLPKGHGIPAIRSCPSRWWVNRWNVGSCMTMFNRKPWC